MLVAIIPARGNSRGVKKKNIKKIGNRTLIDWAIDLANESELVDLTVLSTDDTEVVRNSKSFAIYEKQFQMLPVGAFLKVSNNKGLHKRRPEHATSQSRTIETILDIFNVVKLRETDLILLLQPTSPFRKSSEIVAIKQLIEKNKSKSVVSAKLFDSPHPGKAIKVSNEKLIIDKDTLKNLSAPRQSLPEYYVFDGAFYLSYVENVIKSKSLISDDTSIFIREGSKTVNIDNELDFAFAQNIYNSL